MKMNCYYKHKIYKTIFKKNSSKITQDETEKQFLLIMRLKKCTKAC